MTDFLARVVDALAGRYNVERELGQGGMATVFLAQDLKHKREVAIKVLRADVSQTVGADRFLREIELAAKLTHPHILPLFDSGESGGLLFYVMPNIEGTSLRDRLTKSGPLPIDEAVRLGQEVAGALDYAHRHGVVHRDIKPENIMLHEGHALVADFGIGKAISAVEGDTFTQTGITVGTPAYMSPEQAAGDSVDGRSDIYSLGCMLYEMLTGEQPFTGPTIQAIIAKRFVQTPADITALREGVPRPVARAVQKALARTPIDRFETAQLLLTALGETESTHAKAKGPPPPEKSIAVLPFANMSADPENEFFADGITEEILNTLAQIGELKVAGRTSAFSFKGKNQDLRVIGEQLGVRTVLEGSVRRAGQRVRITAQLIDVTDGYHLWSEKYDREIEDVFAVQDEIAAAIASKLKTTLMLGTAERSLRATESIEAYELYLKGRVMFYRRGSAIRDGVELMKQALALDSTYGLAWAGLADGYTLFGYYGMTPPEASAPAAREALAKAREFAPDLAETHCAGAQVAMLFDWDWERTRLDFQRTLAINPGYLQADTWYSLFYLGFISGKWDEAVARMRATVQREPRSSYATAVLAFTLGYGRASVEAIECGKTAVSIDGTNFLANWALQTSYFFSGRFQESIVVGDRLLNASGRHPWVLAYLAAASGSAGDLASARAAAAELEARGAREYLSPFMFALALAYAGYPERAEAALREAVNRRDPCLPVFSRWALAVPEMRNLAAAKEVFHALKLPNWSEDMPPISGA